MTGPRPTVDQLRTAIDQGAGADKVDFPDPAAAPLGTDAEAAGAPPTPAELAMANTEIRHSGPRHEGAMPAILYGSAVATIGTAAVALVLVALN